ncbi:YhcB family protein [Pseudoalteromonas sp. T1lg65]|uniref:YhcB family protein n=1 Tax=Pseudoalteromonas sp. T1lg65 TaxID=2077101 RepID=UPI003F78E785
MTTITWFGLIILVASAAFYLGTLFTRKQLKQDELEQQVKKAESELEQYRQDVTDHLANTKKLVGKMHDNYQQLVSHVEETNQLLLQEKSSRPTDPFFSKETTEQLQASLKARPEKRRKVESNATDQPTDYAAGETGLFSGSRRESEQSKAS